VHLTTWQAKRARRSIVLFDSPVDFRIALAGGAQCVQPRGSVG
jgi:hypothetical protein